VKANESLARYSASLKKAKTGEKIRNAIDTVLIGTIVYLSVKK
jgi:hypothetical protein